MTPVCLLHLFFPRPFPSSMSPPPQNLGLVSFLALLQKPPNESASTALRPSHPSLLPEHEFQKVHGISVPLLKPQLPKSLLSFPRPSSPHVVLLSLMSSPAVALHILANRIIPAVSWAH